MAKWKKRLLIAAIVLVVLLIAVVIVGANFLVDYSINRQASFSMSNSFGGNSTEKTADQLWLDGISEDWRMEADGLQLHAFFIDNPNPNGRYAVLCHGYGSNGYSVMNFIRHYYDLGYHILVPEARSHGQSEGQYVGMGWPERKDIVRWIDKLTARDDDAPIMLHGISMGGATVMMVSGEKLPANVKCIVEDCGYTSVWDEFSWQMDRIFHLPDFPLLHTANLIAQMRAGYSFSEASALEQVKKSVTPTLFIHGSEDTFVPFAMLDKVYEAAACEKEKLVVEGATHGASSFNYPETYWPAVDAFVEKHMAQ